MGYQYELMAKTRRHAYRIVLWTTDFLRKGRSDISCRYLQSACQRSLVGIFRNDGLGSRAAAALVLATRTEGPNAHEVGMSFKHRHGHLLHRCRKSSRQDCNPIENPQRRCVGVGLRECRDNPQRRSNIAAHPALKRK